MSLFENLIRTYQLRERVESELLLTYQARYTA